MESQIYPTELQLNWANSADNKAPFLDLNLPITNGIVSSKMYAKRGDFNFEMVNYPWCLHFATFARVCSNVNDFRNRNKFLTSKLLKQGYRYHKLHKGFF